MLENMVGKVAGGGVFIETGVYHLLECNSFNVPSNKQLLGTNVSVPQVLLGNQGYALKEYLMRPYPVMNMLTMKQMFSITTSAELGTQWNVLLGSR